MGGSCPAGQHWDVLVKECLSCRLLCGQPKVISRCINYCESTHCKGLPGHYFDVLLKRCISCAEVCGKHPAECSQHCHTTPLPVTTKRLMVPHLTNSRGLMDLEDPTLVLYSLLALCMVLLFSSLSLALAVLMRRSRAKSSKPRPKEAKQKPAVQPGEKLSSREEQLGQTSKDFVTSSGYPPNREQSDDSIPTETCVCIHCFPDLKALGQSNDRPLGPPFSSNQQAGLPVAQTMNGKPLWTEQSHHGPGGGSREIRFLCSPSN